jgi:hypothetical protein
MRNGWDLITQKQQAPTRFRRPYPIKNLVFTQV